MKSGDPALPHWLALIRAPGVGPTHGRRLLQAFGDPDSALNASADAWNAAGVPGSLHTRVRDEAGVERDLAWLRGESRSLLTFDEPDYPAQLREITYAPLALFCRGNPGLLSRPQIAIVGARAATPQGLDSAHGFAAELTRRGLLVTSGLAQGIDGAAHTGALDADGATVAVCGTGLDRVYPARHRELAHRIEARGVLVSEFPTGTPPVNENFPRRNRILSGLSLGVLVVEAAPESGSLITARLALEQGREVFAIPGSIHSPLSRGTHALIRQGAKLTESVHDILEELASRLGMEFPGVDASPPGDGVPAKLSPELQRVIDALGFAETPFDTLVERVAMPVDKLSAALLVLELEGCVESAPGGAYQRVSR